MSNDVNKTGKQYWRSLNQLAETEEFQEMLHREFPEGASELSDSIPRRRFLSIMGASFALAGLASCRKPVEKIVPYVNQPVDIIPGNSRMYATTMPFQNSAYGLLVESHEGRPTKIEGNELHPSSLGKANYYMQAATLEMYDPDRSEYPLKSGARVKYNEFISVWRGLYARYLQSRGEGLAFISSAFSSPSRARLADEIKRKFPRARWVTYEPVSDENIYKGIEIATGRPYQPIYHYENANVVLSLDADFVLQESENVINARGFTSRRHVKSTDDEMNRLYVVEGTHSLTGAMSDHRYRLQTRQVGAFTVALAKALQAQGLGISVASKIDVDLDQFDKNWINELARDLANNRRQGLVVAGRKQPPEVHALVYAINSALGNTGRTVAYRDLTDSYIPDNDQMADLVHEMEDQQIETLVILGSNPVYDTPVDLGFGSAIDNIDNTIHFGLYANETALESDWHIPEAHFLESWGDARAVNGTVSVIQPLIAPLYEGKSWVEFLDLLGSGRDRKGYDIVREAWQDIISGGNFTAKWRRVLHDGILKNSAMPQKSPRVNSSAVSSALSSNPVASETGSGESLEIVFHPSPAVFDGRYANIGWLQELPDGMTKLTWDNAAILSKKTADDLGLESETLIELTYKDHTMKLPVWILPGHADNSISVNLGYGRKSAGRVGNRVGFNTYALRSSSEPWFDLGLQVKETGKHYKLAGTQDHWSLEGRPMVQEATLEEYRQEPHFAEEAVEHPPQKSLWEDYPFDTGYQWGMSIDLNVCTGCNACTIACQSENNIPVVGKEQVYLGREMHWIRIDRYFAGDIQDPVAVTQPMACQHCETAPCEEVCPVNATMHDHEGLNVQVYNRCIGTRYCSNNCPYKVRRFNFLNYTSPKTETEKMAMNPDVTVRGRGVMEKCTYCLQRIKKSEIRAKREDRKLHTDEVISACQQTCPTDAIVFGDINDPNSRVSQVKKRNRNYRVLAELNTQTRTSYLAKLRNPNPALENHQPAEAQAIH